MERKKYVYCWKDGDMWLGYLEEYPDYMTQGGDIGGIKGEFKRHRMYIDTPWWQT